jgi:hypothetical protein
MTEETNGAPTGEAVQREVLPEHTPALCAAAPELLAALKQWEAAAGSEDAADQLDAWKKFEAMARAAIAKAEGRE